MKRLLPLLLAGCASAPRGDGIEWFEVGRSVEGRPILAAEFGEGPDVTLLFAGFHGNEKTGVRLAQDFAREMRWHRHRVVIVPILNPDGHARNTRTNARGVDLNRNFPTKNWGDASLRKKDDPGRTPASEPETRAAIRLVEKYRPARIISIHDPLRVNNFDGPQSEELARQMAEWNGYPVKGDIGYPTPGSFGTWAGVERGIVMVTLETPGGDPAARWRENKYALLAAVRLDKSTRE